LEKTLNKPKKRGKAVFAGNLLTNEDNISYHLGRDILMLWKKCDGSKTIEDLKEIMNTEGLEREYSSEVIRTMLGLLQEKKLVIYSAAGAGL